MAWNVFTGNHRKNIKKAVLESELALIFATELGLKPGKNNLLTFLFVCLFLDRSLALSGHDIGRQFPPVEGAWIRAYVTPRNR